MVDDSFETLCDLHKLANDSSGLSTIDHDFFKLSLKTPENVSEFV